MNMIRATQKLNQQELDNCTPPSASWHNDFKHTAFIYVGGLPFNLTEGDIITIFSQYGEPVYIKLIRDKETGKSKGFCFLKYEDQRSCDLAVDNLGGADVLGRVLRVDHADYKAKEDDELVDNTGAEPASEPSEDEAERRRKARPVLSEERELQALEQGHDPDDPMKAYLVDEKREAVQKAVARWEEKHGKEGGDRRDRHRHRHHRSRRDRDERDDRHDRKRRVRDGSDSPEERPRARRERTRSRSPRRGGRRRDDDSEDDEADRRRRRSRSGERRRREGKHERAKR